MKSISALVSLAALAAPSLGQVISLGTAATFAAVALTDLTSTGTSVVTGDIGSVDTGISGFPPGVLVGTEVFGAGADTASTDARAAFNAARNLTATTALKSTALDTSQTLTPGVFIYEQGASIDGIITLSGAGDFVFQIPSNLATVAGSQVILADGATAANVWWTADNDVVLGANTTIVGNIITLNFIEVGEGAVVQGGLFSGKSITLDSATVTAAT